MNFFKMIKSLFTSAPRFTPGDCNERVRSGEAVLIDVREPEEWTSGVADGAVLLPLSDLTGPRAQWKPFLDTVAGQELLMYCAAGGRSAIAARLLAGEGFRTGNTGGLGDWRTSGWPIVKPHLR